MEGDLRLQIDRREASELFECAVERDLCELKSRLERAAVTDDLALSLRAHSSREKVLFFGDHTRARITRRPERHELVGRNVEARLLAKLTRRGSAQSRLRLFVHFDQ